MTILHSYFNLWCSCVFVCVCVCVRVCVCVCTSHDTNIPVGISLSATSVVNWTFSTIKTNTIDTLAYHYSTFSLNVIELYKIMFILLPSRWKTWVVHGVPLKNRNQLDSLTNMWLKYQQFNIIILISAPQCNTKIICTCTQSHVCYLLVMTSVGNRTSSSLVVMVLPLVTEVKEK